MIASQHTFVCRIRALHYLLGKIVVDDDGVLAVVTEVLSHLICSQYVLQM